MTKVKMLTGNSAAAYGYKLARVEVMPAYPITPCTSIMEKVHELIATGEMDAEQILMESEHSAMAACITSEATGARTCTATSSQGLLYMQENLFVTSGLRLPMVMSIVNRFVGPPQALGADHNDSLGARDTGWIQIYPENGQEVLDSIIQAYKVAEDKRVLTPVAVCHEGLVVSHKMDPVELPDQADVDAFLPPYNPEHVVLDPNNVMALGVAAMDPIYTTEYKYQQQEALENAKDVINEVDAAYGAKFGRSYGGLVSAEMMEGAEVALITMGTITTAAREAIKSLREEKNLPIGLIKLRAFRPFPTEQLREILAPLKVVGVLDKNISPGASGIVYPEVCACFNDNTGPVVFDYVLGIGGRDVTEQEVEAIAIELLERKKSGDMAHPVQWPQLRKKA